MKSRLEMVALTKKKKEEAEQDDKIDFWPGQAQLRISVSEGQLRLSSLEKKVEMLTCWTSAKEG